ncbi:MAG: hypothetical protein U1E60_14800 [Reyranellaceae bacterium]
MTRIALATAFLALLSFQADAKTLTEAVREGYEAKTASGTWLILQKGKSIVFCDTAGGATNKPCTVVE